MESIGERLKKTREERSLTIDQVARDTNISKTFLTYLEADNFDAFPAEPYLLGFLRNYSDYLGLETEELIARYKAFKIQEQPAPMTALMSKPSPWSSKVFVIGGAVAAGVVLLAFLVPAILDFTSHLPSFASGKPTGGPGKMMEYTLGNDQSTLDNRFYKGDTINVSIDSEVYKFQIKEIGTQVVVANAASGDTRLALTKDAYIDLDNNTVPDLRIALTDFVPGDESKGAAMTFDRLVKPKELNETGSVSLNQEVKPAQPGSEGQPQAGVSGSAANPSRERKTQVVMEGSEAKPFTVDVVFRGYCLIRTVVDGGQREEVYVHKGEPMQIEASRKVALWVSNAGAFTGRINGVELEIGKPGEVASVIIEWSTDPATGKAVLKSSPMY